MPIVQPPPARYAVEDLGPFIVMTVPTRKNWFVVVYLSCWLVIWVFGGIIAGGTVAAGFLATLRGQTSGTPAAGLGATGLFILAWLGIWAAFSALAIYSWLWQVTGKEVIQVSRQSIVINQVVLDFSRSKEYLAKYIRNLRVSPLQMSPWGWPNAFLRFPGGMLAFDYGPRTFHFVEGVDEAEARQIAAMIKARFPALARVTGVNAYSA